MVCFDKLSCFQVEGEDICDLAQRYMEYQSNQLEDFTLPSKEDLAKMLKSLSVSARGLKTQEHYMKKVASAIQEKCGCLLL